MQERPQEARHREGRRSHSKDTDTPDVHRVRQGRLPRSPRAPIIAGVERHCNDDRPGSDPVEQSATSSSVGGPPSLGGGEKKQGRVR